MKKFLLFVIVAIMLAACSTDTTENVASTLPYDVLYVSVGDEDESRIQLDGNSRIVWNEGDKVSVFNKTNGNECWQFDGKTGDMSGTLSKVSGNAGLISTDKVIALYPYDPKCAVSGNMISTTIPAMQKYRADSFGDGGSIMVAVSDDDNLFFDSVLGWIKLSLTDDLERKVHSIVLNGNNGEKLVGSIIIDANTQKVYMEGNNISSITLDCGEGVQLSKTAPAYFYIALAPQAFAKGVSVDVKTTDGKLLKKYYEESFSVTRNRVYTIKAGNLQSANNNTIFYTTTDGESVIMGTTEGFGANFISNTYESGQGIIRFDRNITCIPSTAFSFCDSLTSVTISDSVTSIGMGAFYGCINLTSVTIGDGVTSIGEVAFRDCHSLTSVTIPDRVTEIGEGAFDDCSSLTSITIPDSVTSIGMVTFYNCSSLKSVTIPDSVTSIGEAAFYCCSSLTSVTIPDSVTSIGEMAFSRCSRLIAFYGKYASIDNRHLVQNGNLIAFAPSGLTEYSIPNGVTSIGCYAFDDCSSLTSITIPDSVTSIGEGAFRDCSSLKSVTIPDSVTSIGKSAFYNCSSLKSVTIPDSVTSIGDYAFIYCSSLTSITIPDSVTEIGVLAFRSCSNLTSVTIPDSVTSIGDSAFSYCRSLTSVTIGDSVTSIGDSAFSYCSSLTSITIPDSVTSIEDSAFKNCRRLECIYCKPITPPTLGGYVFSNISSMAKIYVPTESVDVYKSRWSAYKSNIVGYDF